MHDWGRLRALAGYVCSLDSTSYQGTAGDTEACYSFGDDKEQAQLRAMELFPAADLRQKKDHDRAEALLLAYYHRQMQCATGEAVETLRSVMQDAEASASARVSAAKAILETAIKGIEIEDLEVRIAALEAQGEPR